MSWMCLISRNEVPLYLQSGELFKSFCLEDEEPFLVPDDAVKQDLSITDLAELKNVLFSLRYWIVEAVPTNLLDFCLNYSENGAGLTEVLLLFTDSLRYTGCILEMCKVTGAARMAVAMRWGILDIVQYLVAIGYDPEVCVADAAGCGHLHCLQFTHDHQRMRHDIEITRTTYNRNHYLGKLSAISGGHLCCLAFLHGIEPKLSANMCTEAAEHGHLDCLKYLHEHNCPWDRSTPLIAIRKGHVECLHYAISSGCPLPDNMASIAVEAGQPAALSSLYSQGYASDHNLTAIALAYKQFECFVLAYEIGCPFATVLTRFAAITGQLRFLQYMHEHCGVSWDPAACTGAAANGRLACLIYLHDRGAAWDQQTCSEAAAHGHLECLKYAHDHGAPWGEETCSRAAANGRIECLKYAHENGCSWSELTGRAAAQHGQLVCLQYVLDHHCPCRCDAVAHALAVAGGHTQCAVYLQQFDCPTGLKIIKNGTVVDPTVRSYMNFDAAFEL